MEDEVRKVIEEDIKPMLKMHGGDIELIDVTDEGVVKVKLTGACAGCPMSQMTILGVVQQSLMNRIPKVKGVEAA